MSTNPFRTTEISWYATVIAKNSHPFSGDTKTELSHALSSQAIDVHVASKCLANRIIDSTGATLNRTNDFFLSHEYKDNEKAQKYKRNAETLYGATFYNCNFVNRPDKAVKRINLIVQSRSNGLIADLFSPGDLSNETKLIIVNTIAFKSNWLNQFDSTKTTYGDFHVDQSATKLVSDLNVNLN